MQTEVPNRITKRWLQSLSDDELRAVEQELSARDNYQSYAHARTMSEQWERAYDELQRRLRLRQEES